MLIKNLEDLMQEGNGFMNDINHSDIIKILDKLDEIEKEVSEIKLAQQDATGKLKGNQEMTELKLAHMVETNQLKAEKYEAEMNLIDTEVQRNKESIDKLFTKNTESEKLGSKVTLILAILGALSIPIIYGAVQIILHIGKG